MRSASLPRDCRAASRSPRSPASTTDSTATLNIPARRRRRRESYPVTLSATGAGIAGTQTTAFNVQVTPAPGGNGNVVFSFANCDPSEVPVRFPRRAERGRGRASQQGRKQHVHVLGRERRRVRDGAAGWAGLLDERLLWKSVGHHGARARQSVSWTQSLGRRRSGSRETVGSGGPAAHAFVGIGGAFQYSTRPFKGRGSRWTACRRGSAISSPWCSRTARTTWLRSGESFCAERELRERDPAIAILRYRGFRFHQRPHRNEQHGDGSNVGAGVVSYGQRLLRAILDRRWHGPTRVPFPDCPIRFYSQAICTSSRSPRRRRPDRRPARRFCCGTRRRSTWTP